MHRFGKLLMRLHPLGTLTVLAGLVLNTLDLMEWIHLDQYGDWSWFLRIGPLLLGSSVVFGAVFLFDDDA